MPAGKILRVETLRPAVAHWGVDAWEGIQDIATHDTGLGVHVADLATTELPPGRRVDVTFYWSDVGRWEGADFCVVIGSVRG